MVPKVSRFAAGAKGEASLHEENGYAVLSHLYVAPEHRGAGVGRRLLKRVLRYAAQQNLTVKLRAQAFDVPDMDTEALVAMYLRYGFERLKGMEMIWVPGSTKAL